MIKDRIAGGSAIIEGTFTPEEAHDLALVLRAGSLPAPVKILEERNVGPSLGEDSIRLGRDAILLGIILIAIGMTIYYKWSGIVAVIALDHEPFTNYGCHGFAWAAGHTDTSGTCRRRSDHWYGHRCKYFDIRAGQRNYEWGSQLRLPWTTDIPRLL